MRTEYRKRTTEGRSSCRAREVDLAAGFAATDVGNLLIKEVGSLESGYRAQLIQQAIEVGAF